MAARTTAVVSFAGAHRSISYCMLAVASITPSSKLQKLRLMDVRWFLKTPDGFLSLRDGPGMRFKVLEKLRQLAQALGLLAMPPIRLSDECPNQVTASPAGNFRSRSD